MLIYRVSANQRLILSDGAREKMMSFAQHRWNQREAGGILLGRYLLDSDDVVVDEVTEPQQTDARTRYSFFRSEAHMAIARRRWTEEVGTACYLGLWHTHPEACPTPSDIDLIDWFRAAKRDVYHGNRLFFPIVGTRSMRMWTISRRGTFRELKAEEK